MNKELYKLSVPLKHIAFIMDGNGRWAKKRLLPRHLGHKEGCLRIIDILKACQEFGIRVMSLYCFSTENWKRPKDEIDHLFKYLEEFFNREIDNLVKDEVRIRTMGELSKLPLKTQEVIKNAKERTKNNEKFILNICLNYGGRDEIVRAVNKIIETNPHKSITEDEFSSYLDSSSLPEVDLLIRTSGEQRISNYMLWQLAYAEFIFTPTYWPDFKKPQLIECLKEYELRNRRYGGL